MPDQHHGLVCLLIGTWARSYKFISTISYNRRTIVSPQHVGDDEVSYVAAPDVYLLEMRYTAIARSDGDIFELHIHVVLSCPLLVAVFSRKLVAGFSQMRTFNKLAAVDLAGSDLECDNVALIIVSAGLAPRNNPRTAASLRSLIGIPIVLVISPIPFAILKIDW